MVAYQDFLPSAVLKQTLALSPDGKQVAYIDDALGQFNVVVQSLSGGPRRLTSYQNTTVIAVYWYPDGQALLFLADTKGNENYQLSSTGSTSTVGRRRP